MLIRLTSSTLYKHAQKVIAQQIQDEDESYSYWLNRKYIVE